MKQPKGWLKLVLGFVLAVVTFFAQAIFLLGWIDITGSEESSLSSIAFAEVAGGITALLFIVALGGKKYLRTTPGWASFAWQAARAFLIANIAIAALSVSAQIATGEGKPLADSWVQNTIVLLLLCIGVGMFEEGLFRGLVLQGLLARMGTSKKGVLAALIISSLLFGLTHVISTDMQTDPNSLLQMVFKTLQTGIIGFVLGYIVIKTHSLVPAVIIHGFTDFVLMFVNIGLWGDGMTFDYVVSGEESADMVVMYVFMCALYLPSLLFCIRDFKKMPGGERGAFYKLKSVPQGEPAMQTAGFEPPAVQVTGEQPQMWGEAPFGQNVGTQQVGMPQPLAADKPHSNGIPIPPSRF